MAQYSSTVGTYPVYAIRPIPIDAADGAAPHQHGQPSYTVSMPHYVLQHAMLGPPVSDSTMLPQAPPKYLPLHAYGQQLQLTSQDGTPCLHKGSSAFTGCKVQGFVDVPVQNGWLMTCDIYGKQYKGIIFTEAAAAGELC